MGRNHRAKIADINGSLLPVPAKLKMVGTKVDRVEVKEDYVVKKKMVVLSDIEMDEDYSDSDRLQQ